ncbi:MAG: bifunctional demethylmenaquinone methyltransferase/2-methoxy-6-polyprenyl-1,4-benzoquinol methylase UbiE [Deltaproteobacteria bacterium]|nr:bifunctional demethylmenaquinone methyltransferase/2-methoxy-6-polyprenyl-1,4-benzoquinol methylase UbiE [Deltaproteobacteria bacterium]
MTNDNKLNSPSEPLDGSGQMFDKIAKRYDLLNRILSIGQDQHWRRAQIEKLAISGGPANVLDLATGTADVALQIAYRYPQATIIGVDPSLAMLEIGRKKIKNAGLENRINLIAGDAQDLQFADASFDAVCMSFGIRNVPNRQKALAEIARVTRKDGKVLILELAKTQQGRLAKLAQLYLRYIIPGIGGLLAGAHEYKYLRDSIATFPGADKFAQMMQTAGLHITAIEHFCFGVVHLFIAEK